MVTEVPPTDSVSLIAMDPGIGLADAVGAFAKTPTAASDNAMNTRRTIAIHASCREYFEPGI